MFRQAITLWKRERKHKGTRLQRRLFAFFAMSGAAVILLFVSLLLLFDITGSGTSEVRQFVQSDLSHISEDIGTNFGRLSVQGVSFSEVIASNADGFFKGNGISTEQLKEHPELIKPFLAAQMQAMTGAMEYNLCSGVFLLLDATVNPSLENAQYSRAGIFLKKTDPNAVSAVGSDIYYLRGPSSIARENGINLMGQWRMEFDIRGEKFFEETMETAKVNSNQPLSRLYHWSHRTTLLENSESGILLCVPLRSKSGEVFGVCGFEISDRLFKRQYSPDNSTYSNIFAAIAPSDGKVFHVEQGLIAGNYYLTSACMPEPLEISEGSKDFSLYSGGTNIFGGIHTDVKLYPTDSVYNDEKWIVSVMMNEKTLHNAITGNTPYLLMIIGILLLTSLGMSIFISRRYLRPVEEGLNAIKSRNYGCGAVKNPYVEINDLMEFLAQQDEKQKDRSITLSKPQGDSTLMFEVFIRNAKTLSPAEKSVFDLYVKGYHAQEIADELCLSINTIKTHNRRIFAKLNVSTRKELLVYLDMMKKLDMIKEGPHLG